MLKLLHFSYILSHYEGTLLHGLDNFHLPLGEGLATGGMGGGGGGAQTPTSQTFTHPPPGKVSPTKF